MERFVMITQEGAFLAKYLTTKQTAGKCYRCAFYKYCTKERWNACNELSGSYHFVKPILDSPTMQVRPEDVDFSHPKVRYKGVVMDKIGLKSLIHDTEFMLRNDAWPLSTDIYWNDLRYDELVKRLKENIYTIDILIKYNP